MNEKSDELRASAEAKAGASESAINGALTHSPEEANRVLHELRVHQIELEIQNEELRRAQLALEISQSRYFDLYDLAPVGYVTVNEKGLIMEANLTASTLLGTIRKSLVNKPLSQFCYKEDLDSYYRFFKTLFDSRLPQVSEIRLINDPFVWVSLEAATVPDNAAEYRVILADISKRKRTEQYWKVSSEILGILNDALSWQDTINRVLAAIKLQTGFDAVGIRLKKGEDFPYFAQDGFSKEFLLTENTLIARTPTGEVCRDKNGAVSLECTCGLVLSGATDPANPLFTKGGSAWTNNALPLLDLPAREDPRLNPLNNCTHKGFLSVALIPIRANQKIVGLLQLNDRKKDRLDIDMIGFFEGLCGSIGLAIMRKFAHDDLVAANEKLETFNRAMVSREVKMVELKKMVNGLCVKAGEPLRF